MMTIERRGIPLKTSGTRIEKRADGTTVIVGYAAVFYRADNPGTEFRLWGNVYERIHRNAFDRAILEDDTVALWDHRSEMPLGRREAGTLRLSIDDIGLRYEIDPPDTTAGKDALISIGRGDVRGSSFGFATVFDEWTIENRGQSNEKEIRTLTDLTLLDVSPVTYPAYEATSVDTTLAKRSLTSWQEREALEASRQQQRSDSISRRLKLLSLR